MSLTVERIRELASTRVFVRGSIIQVKDDFKVDLLAMTFSDGWLAGVDYTHSMINSFESGGFCFFEPGGTISLDRSLRQMSAPALLSNNETYLSLWFTRGEQVGEALLSDWRFLQTLPLVCKEVEKNRDIRARDESKNRPSISALNTLRSRLGALLYSQNVIHSRSMRSLGAVH